MKGKAVGKTVGKAVGKAVGKSVSKDTTEKRALFTLVYNAIPEANEEEFDVDEVLKTIEHVSLEHKKKREMLMKAKSNGFPKWYTRV